jgi:Tfp pilus assembly protein FimV
VEDVSPQQHQPQQHQQQKRQLLLQEAKHLYESVLHIRNQVQAKDHPDVYATKYSLAEVLEVLGDEEGANALRQEILDTYTPSEKEEKEDKNKTVVIEKTKTSRDPTETREE